MKVKLNIDPNLDDGEIIISAPEMNEKVARIYRLLQENNHIDQIEGYKDKVSYYLALDDILFFETDSKVVMAHTSRDAYQVKYKLYELENLLGANFMRISKSTILNLEKIYAITRSISNCQIKFQDSYKTVYASRHYYRDLRNRLEERRELL